VTFPGPFRHHDVVVSGWQVPLLQAYPSADEQTVSLVLDRRYALELTVAESERIIPFIADAIAVALGYARHPDARSDLLPLDQGGPRRVHGISLEVGET
jgi:hypothetical protein